MKTAPNMAENGTVEIGTFRKVGEIFDETAVLLRVRDDAGHEVTVKLLNAQSLADELVRADDAVRAGWTADVTDDSAATPTPS